LRSFAFNEIRLLIKGKKTNTATPSTNISTSILCYPCQAIHVYHIQWTNLQIKTNLYVLKY